jgi:hypothetical protein
MAERVIRQDAALFDDLEERQDEIAGNAEDLFCAMVLEGLEQRGAERLLAGHALRFPSTPR